MGERYERLGCSRANLRGFSRSDAVRDQIIRSLKREHTA
jgi:hypothetical protein